MGVLGARKCNRISVQVLSAMFLPVQVLGRVYMGEGGREGNFISTPVAMGVDRIHCEPYDGNHLTGMKPQLCATAINS